MAYTPDAEDTAQPTGNQALSTAALEFRTLKTHIQATKTAQAAATALVASNLAAAIVAQDVRDDEQDFYVEHAIALGTTGIDDAAAALAVAQGKLTKEVLTGSGNWTVPAGVTSVLAIVQGGSTAEAAYSQGSMGGLNFSFFSVAQAGDVQARNVTTTPAATIAYSCGVGQSLQYSGAPTKVTESVTATGTTFDSVTAAPAKSFTALNPTGAFVAKAASSFAYSNKYDGHLADILVAGPTLETSTMTAGAAGTITLLY